MKKIIFMFVAAVTMIGLFGCGDSETAICETACELITEQYARVEEEAAPTCQNVELIKKISETSWFAEAKLSNGKTIKLMVSCEDGMVSVDMTAQAIADFKQELDQAQKDFESDIDD